MLVSIALILDWRRRVVVVFVFEHCARPWGAAINTESGRCREGR